MNVSRRRGQGQVEYGLILIFIAVVAISSTDTLRKWVAEMWNDTSTKIESVCPVPTPSPGAQV